MKWLKWLKCEVTKVECWRYGRAAHPARHLDYPLNFLRLESGNDDGTVLGDVHSGCVLLHTLTN